MEYTCNYNLTFQRLGVIFCTTQFNIHELYILHTVYLSVLMDLRTNDDYFLVQCE